LSKQLGQSFIVENRAGAGTNIATEVAVRASPDGYTLLHVTVSNVINATLYANPVVLLQPSNCDGARCGIALACDVPMA
jgi:tripartite-type tricarboxylate transporter receptor subunit TctC